MSIINKSILAVMITGVVFTGMAHAASLGGDGATTTAEVTFTSDVNLTNTLVASGPFASGIVNNDTILATGNISSNDGIVYPLFLIHVSNGERDSTTNTNVILSGKNNPDNKLRVGVKFNEANSFIPMDGVRYAGSVEDITSADYSVYTVSASGSSQVVNSDVYTIQTTAYTYVD